MNRKIILIFSATIFLLFSLFIAQNYSFSDSKLHIVFCNVGQGDGIFIKTPEGMDIIVDGGPDASILSCLSNHMPFWDRTIELILLTHPHLDHLNGFLDVLPRYNVLSFMTEELENNTAAFKALKELFQSQHVPLHYLSAGSSSQTSKEVRIAIVGPNKTFLEKTSPNGKIGESREFASLETLISYGSFTILLTGDSQASELNEARIGALSVLQVPHHGSKTGLDLEFLQKVHPKLAVISVGKNNYGHPSAQTLDLLKSRGIPVLRTDEHGDVEIVSDGKTWFVK